MKLQFYYTEDKDCKKFLAFRRNGKYDPPIKRLDRGEWFSPAGTYYVWISTSDHNGQFLRDTMLEIINNELANIPEPSWDDEFPMLVTLDIQCTNVNYSYIENEGSSNE